MDSSTRQRVVIVGGGFGGLYCAQSLRSPRAEVNLVDRRNHHLFQPLLYQVATGGLSPGDIAAPLRGILARRPNVRVRLDEVHDFDLERRELILETGRIPWDVLVVAAGMRSDYFGNDSWREHAPGLKSIEDATRMRARILGAFERAEQSRDDEERRALLTFVIVGAGPTGVELAGALAELARDTLRHEFRSIDPSETRVVLVDGSDRVLPVFHEKLSRRAERDLREKGVEIRQGSLVREVTAGRVTWRGRDGAEETVDTPNVLWAAGVRASPLASRLAEAVGAETDRQGRLAVTDRLELDGRPDIFVIGDMAAVDAGDGGTLPGLAPVAMQQGRYVARRIEERLEGRDTKPFRYRDKGQLATIGRAAAVAEIHGLRFSGFTAWVLWLLVHLAYLVGFENRVLVLIQWMWCYLTWNRSARLIVGDDGLDPRAAPPGEAAASPERETAVRGADRAP